jgi:XTP/dITP diphosphohydrolase
MIKNKTKTPLVFATNNNHKFEEVRDILKKIPVELIPLKKYNQIPEIEEIGKTFAENALIKAKVVYQHTKLWTIADDSGLEVWELGGQPGIHSARFSGDSHDYFANNKKLLELMENITDSNRQAQFRCVVAIVGANFERLCEGIVKGKIIQSLRGTEGFGYDPLFVPEGYNKTFAELDVSLKNQISHRAIAFKKAATILKSVLTSKATDD